MNNALLTKPIILVTGANGQLGMELRHLSAAQPDYEFIFTGREELDISNRRAVDEYFEKNKALFCINCAAYTAVDKAEKEKLIAEEINTDGPAHLASACRDHGVQMFHISTDYVFNGRGNAPYRPGDATDPVNFYGTTKLNGEKKALIENSDIIIIRTAWVYSSFGNNFVKTMIRLMNQKESINVVSDQLGTPTYAADLADAIIQIIRKKKFVPGIYHYTNTGITSWFDFAKEIATGIGTNCIVLPINTDQYPTPAARPAYSALDNEKISSVFGIDIPEWRESLKRCLALMNNV